MNPPKFRQLRSDLPRFQNEVFPLFILRARRLTPRLVRGNPICVEADGGAGVDIVSSSGVGDSAGFGVSLTGTQRHTGSYVDFLTHRFAPSRSRLWLRRARDTDRSLNGGYSSDHARPRGSAGPADRPPRG